jgi:hypothetical protein
MTTANLNVFVAELGQPCTISNRRWVVAVLHCDGRLLNWSEGRYRYHSEDPWTNILPHVPPHTPDTPPLPKGWYYDNVPAENGHVEIEVPPGCYVLVGSMHTWYTHGIFKGNWYTDHAIVQAVCGQDVCTTLYAPTEERCGRPLADFVIPLLVQHQIVKREDAQRAIEAIRAVFGPVETMSPFEQEEVEWLKMSFQRMAEEGKKEDPKQE